MEGIQTFLGDSLVELRIRRGMTVGELARIIGRSLDYVRGIETGLVDTDAEVALKLREALDVTPSELRRVRDWSTVEGRRELQRFADTMQLGVDDRCRIAALASRTARNLVYTEELFNRVYQLILDKPVGSIFEDEDKVPDLGDPKTLAEWRVQEPGWESVLFCRRCGFTRTLAETKCRNCRYEFPDD